MDSASEKKLPKYLQIRDSIEQRIRANEWKPGDQIPPLGELVEIYGASVQIVRQAISLLVQDRLLYRQQGAGTFVCREDATHTPLSEHRHSLRIAEWLSTEPASVRIYEQIKKAYETAYAPGVLVNRPAPWPQQLRSLFTCIGSGAAPDVAQVVSEWVPQLAAIEALSPLEDLLPKKLLDSRFPESGLASGMVNGRLYAIDWLPGPLLLFCNKTLMAQAQLDPERPPTTMDQFDYMIRQIGKLGWNRNGDRIYGLGVATSDELCEITHLLPIFWSFGGGMLRNANGRVPLLNRGDRQALAWLADLAKEKHIAVDHTVAELRTLFAENQVGFVIDIPWLRGFLRGSSALRSVDDLYQVSRIPCGKTGRPESAVINHALCLMQQSNNPKQALAFMELVTSSQELAMWLLDDLGIIPGDRELAHSIRDRDPYYATVVDQMEASTSPVSDLRHIKAVEQLLMEMINGVIVNGYPVDAQVDRYLPSLEVLAGDH